MTDKIKVIKLTDKLDRKEVKDFIHRLYEKYYGDGL